MKVIVQCVVQGIQEREVSWDDKKTGAHKSRKMAAVDVLTGSSPKDYQSAVWAADAEAVKGLKVGDSIVLRVREYSAAKASFYADRV